MTLQVCTIDDIGCRQWDAFVRSRPDANLYHLSGWKTVIEKTYGHKTHYLVAVDGKNTEKNQIAGEIRGVLPLTHMRHFVFGNKLISIPFFDMGGILAADESAEIALLSGAIRYGEKLNVSDIELRHAQPMACLAENKLNFSKIFMACHTQTHKARMLLELPSSSEVLMKSFKSKLRTKIKRPLKSGLYTKIGGIELFDDFYSVFCINMRDLGSPVHSGKIIKNTVKEFSRQSKIVIAYMKETPVACGLVIGYQATLENPWASSLKELSRLRPNMLLYWSMLEYACDNGYTKFDFGRSTPGEGTYEFKKQWGATPYPLYWHTLSKNGKSALHQNEPEKSKFSKAIQYWQKLPVSVTKIAGPLIRKHISL